MPYVHRNDSYYWGPPFFMWKRLFSSRFIQSMKIRPVPALQDNYMYLLIDEKTHKAAAIDPVEPENVAKAIAKMCIAFHSSATDHFGCERRRSRNRDSIDYPSSLVVRTCNVCTIIRVYRHCQYF